MVKVYLFDWGDTLMVVFPDQKGKMCNWQKIKSVEYAFETLQAISSQSRIYIATNAADSTAAEIEYAFEKVGLSVFISGYFCKANLGIAKGTKEYFFKIAEVLKIEPSNMFMIGDSLDNDILPAIEAGVTAVWFNPKKIQTTKVCCQQIRALNELCTQ